MNNGGGGAGFRGGAKAQETGPANARAFVSLSRGSGPTIVRTKVFFFSFPALFLVSRQFTESSAKPSKKKAKKDNADAEGKKKKKKKKAGEEEAAPKSAARRLIIESSESLEEEEKQSKRARADLSHLSAPADFARATVLAAMRSATNNPVAKEAAAVMAECARMFVHWLAARSDELAREGRKGKAGPVLPESVLGAARDLELDYMIGAMEETLAKELEKKEEKARERNEKTLRDRLKALEEGTARVEPFEAEDEATTKKKRGKPPKKKLEHMTMEEIRAALNE